MLACIRKGSNEKPKKSKICNGAELITAEAVLERTKKQEEEKQNKICLAASKRLQKKYKDPKNQKRKKNENKEKITSEHETSEEEQPNISSSESENEGLITMIENEKKEYEEERIDIPHEPKKSDWVVVRFCTKKAKKFFVGQITEIKDEPVVKFVRKVSETKYFTLFQYPQVDDKSEILREDIVSVLPPPIIGRRGEIQFQVTFSSYKVE